MASRGSEAYAVLVAQRALLGDGGQPAPWCTAQPMPATAHDHEETPMPETEHDPEATPMAT